jgi:CRISPR-associated protein Cst2
MSVDQIQHMSIVGELTINLASLNNEGTEGNATQPRTAVVVKDRKLYTVPAISGDMVKHWHAQHLSIIAQERGLPLSEYARGRNMDPNRLKGELARLEWVRKQVPEAAEWTGELKGRENAPKVRKLEERIYGLLASQCVVTDAHGLLITEVDTTRSGGGFKASVAVPRTGRVQFGFMAGLPQISNIQHYFHAKYTTARTGIQSRETSTGEGQNIFTRPASSAVFAFVAVLDLAGLGWNDAANKYEIEEDDRRKRKQAVIDAMSYTLMHQPGANTSQQFPHVMDFKGAIVGSRSRCPAPTVSAMKEDYREVLQRLVATANTMNGNAKITMHQVENIAEAVEKLTELSGRSLTKHQAGPDEAGGR